MKAFVLTLAGLAAIAGGIVIAVLLLTSDSGDPPVVRTTTTASATPKESPFGDSYRMVIEKLGVDAPVATYGLDENAIPVVPTGADAAEVVAWYSFSGRPGEGSNAVYAGHVTWNGPAVFEQLDKIAAGDIIRLVGPDGAEAVYRVTYNESLEPEDPKARDSMNPTDKDVITLITCGGTFYGTGDPVFGGDYTHRIIIRAELQDLKRA